MDKVEARRSFRRKSIPEPISRAVIERLAELPEYRAAPLVLAYFPLADEIDITPLLEKGEKNFAFPVTDKDGSMYFAAGDGFRTGSYGLREPLGVRIESFEEGTLIIMPALAYDKAMRRIGRGGGYYDRFIEKHPALIKVGAVPEERILGEVITEAYDASADIIVTESSVLRIEAL